MDWDEIIGRLLATGLSRQQVGDLTMRNVHQIIDAQMEDRIWQARLAGADVDEETHVIDESNAMMLENMINTAVRGG